jgi:hypothetical protein
VGVDSQRVPVGRRPLVQHWCVRGTACGCPWRLRRRRALADGRVDPAAITYVETHGTGTALGDPIEVEALREVLGRAGEEPCVLGAVKTNIGHLEAAAGIAGMLMNMIYPDLKGVFEASTRKATVIVSWKRGEKEYSLELVQC